METGRIKNKGRLITREANVTGDLLKREGKGHVARCDKRRIVA